MSMQVGGWEGEGGESGSGNEGGGAGHDETTPSTPVKLVANEHRLPLFSTFTFEPVLAMLDWTMLEMRLAVPSEK